MKVYEALAEAFAAEGTRAVFEVMGDANMYWLNALDRLGVRRGETPGGSVRDGIAPGQRE